MKMRHMPMEGDTWVSDYPSEVPQRTVITKVEGDKYYCDHYNGEHHTFSAVRDIDFFMDKETLLSRGKPK